MRESKIQQLSEADRKKLHAGEYVEEYLKKPMIRVERLIPFFELKPVDSVIDCGCGIGMLAQLISKKISRYVGIDFSEEFVNAASNMALQQGVGNVSFICTDIVDYCQLHPNAFDKAFTLDFSEHIYDEEFIRIYTSIHGSLKRNGTLFIHTPDGDYFLEKMKKIGILRQFPQHVAVRNSKSNVQLLQQSGFVDIEVKHIPHYVNPLKQFHFLSHLPVFGKFFAARLLIVCRKH